MIHTSTTTTPPASNPPTSKCFAHQHMSATEYAIYDVCRAMASRHDGVVFFSGPQIAEKFRSMSRNTPYTAVKALQKDGWFVKKKESGYRSNGTRTPTHYRVLTHEEWCALHPDSCPDHSEDWQTSLSKLEVMAESPSKLEGRPSQSECSPSQSECEPSKAEGTNLYKTPIANTHTNTDTFAPQSKLEVTAFIERFDKHAKRKKRKAVTAEATYTGARPVPQNGMAVSSTPTRDTSDGRPQLAASNLEPKFTWDLTRLLSRGHDRDTIKAVAKYYRATCGDEIVQREGISGFEVAFGRLLKEMKEMIAQQNREEHIHEEREAA